MVVTKTRYILPRWNLPPGEFRDSQAIATNVTKRLWEIGDIVDVLEAWEQSQTKVARHDTQETR